MALTSINADGWSATYGSPPTFDPVGSPQTFTVARSGFNSSGTGVTVNDTITLMKRIRQPYPNQGTLTADQVALSEFVYSGETISGVTNNSTRAYPKPQAMWLTPDLERCRTTTFNARLAVSHAYARSGRPVAAVKFIASDGTNTVNQTVSTMTTASYAGSGFYAPYFEAAINTSTLNQGALITLDVIIYPWVGDAFQASVDASTYPSPNFTVLKFLNDRTGGYGEAYAYVDTAGNNGTAVVSATPATAAASPYATIAAAAAAIQTFNNTTYSRNNASGGTVRVNTGTFNHGSFSSVAVGEIALVVEAANAGNKSSTIYTDNGTSVTNGMPDKIKFKDMTLKKVGASVVLIDSAATTSTPDNMCVLENVTIDQNSTSSYSGWINRPGRLYLVNCDGGAAATMNTLANGAKWINVIGCNGPWEGDAVYGVCASRLTRAKLRDQVAAGNMFVGAGAFIGFSHLTQPSNGAVALQTSGTIGPRGFAAVMSVLEQSGGTTSPLMALNADNNTNPTENMVRIGLTVVGARTNEQYQDTGTTTIAKSGFKRFCVDETRNTKTDVFGTADGARVGNWPEVFKTGHRFNYTVSGGDDSATPGTTDAWAGEVVALGDLNGTSGSPRAPAWASDLSFPVTTGGGDYSPGSGSDLPLIPSGSAPYPIDYKGRSISNAGTARIGALQQAAGAGYTISVTPMSLAATGQSVGLIPSRKIALAVTGYNVTGQLVAMNRGKTLAIRPLVMNFIGGQLVFNGDPMVLDGDPLVLSYPPVRMLAGKRIAVLPMAATATGQSVTLRATRRLAVTPATFAATMQPLNAFRSRIVVVAPASVALTGQAVQVRTARTLAASVAAFSATGQSVTLRPSRRIGVTQMVLAVTPQLLNFVKGGPAGYTIQVTPAAFTSVGQSVTLSVARKIAVNPLAMVYSGQTATLRPSRTISVAASSFAATGQAVNVYRTRVVFASPAAFAVTGLPVTLRPSRRLAVAPMPMALVSGSVGVIRGHSMAVSPLSLAVSGQAGVIYGRTITVAPLSMTLTGESVRFTSASSLTLVATQVTGPSGMEVWRIG